ncbi:unnamed protein product [Microthlaspi erraticum]|uniref:Uncharacterized protein n=1 Tax=Microthlaspi erraticum TaxID=1685480 RepID=A0A6D2IIP7_9BRAS|nr:unnamed protein product [Microthlaspi erraticum]
MRLEEQGRTWCMDAAQLDTQRKKEEVILKTSSTSYSTIRSSFSTRPAKLQLDRAEKSTVKPEKCYVYCPKTSSSSTESSPQAEFERVKRESRFDRLDPEIAGSVVARGRDTRRRL